MLVERHETRLAKKAAMKAAGELLSRPATYRAAIAAADMALALLPRFVIYNGLNAWGRRREVPSPPKQTFYGWYRADREGTMSGRNEILTSVRKNLPRVDRPLPDVPLFDDSPPASLLSAFKDRLQQILRRVYAGDVAIACDLRNGRAHDLGAGDLSRTGAKGSPEAGGSRNTPPIRDTRAWIEGQLYKPRC